MLFLLLLIIFSPNWLLWGWQFSLANVWLGPLLGYFLGSPF
jgi:hypothetical protein